MTDLLAEALSSPIIPAIGLAVDGCDCGCAGQDPCSDSLMTRSRRHEEAATDVTFATARVLPGQRLRDILSARPCWYAASRDALSACS